MLLILASHSALFGGEGLHFHCCQRKATGVNSSQELIPNVQIFQIDTLDRHCIVSSNLVCYNFDACWK